MFPTTADKLPLFAGLTDACDIAFAATKCTYEADPEVSLSNQQETAGGISLLLDNGRERFLQLCTT